MRLLSAFAAHEWRLARRDNRYRLTVLLYLVLASAPAVLLVSYQRQEVVDYGPGTFMDFLSFVQPFLTVLMMIVLATDGVVREQRQGSWTVLTLAEMSNAGYLLRRWGALLAVTLPWILVPLLVTMGAAAMAGIPVAELLPFLPSWALRILPPALAMAALALGLGTVGGGLFSAAFFFALATLLVSPLIDRLLVPAGMVWRGFGEWLGGADFNVMAFVLTRAPFRNFLRVAPTHDVPVDLGEAAAYWAARGLVAFGVSFLVLALGAFLLRRTVADTPPWQVSPRHPLRSFLGLANRLRQRFRPEPRPAAADFFLLACGLAICAAAVAGKVAMHRHYLALAEERYTAEVAEKPPPTPRALAVTAVRVEGRLQASGRVETAVRMTVESQENGESPEAAGGHLAFTLDPGLTVRSLEASTGRAVVSYRAWDRLAVALEPPLEPGESRTLHCALTGVPRTISFFVLGFAEQAFASRFQHRGQARFARDLADLTHSGSTRAVDRHQVDLRPEQILPLPRYTPWELSLPGTDMRATGMEVREEESPAVAELELDLEGPPGLHLTSLCGGIARPGERLVQSCFGTIQDLRVLGREMEILRDGDLRFAVFRLHRQAAEFHLPAIDRVAELVDRAWPGEAELPPVTLLEWSPPPRPATAQRKLSERWMMDMEYRSLESYGNLVLLDDYDLLQRRPIPPEVLVGRTMAAQLLTRRPMAPDQREVLRFTLEHLVRRRLGLARESAVLPPQQNRRLLTTRLWPPWRWDGNGSLRARAMLNYLIYLAGEGPFYATVERFLRRGQQGTPEPGTFEELVAMVEAERGLDLAGFWQDFLEGEALPDPALEGVRFQHLGGAAGWRVTGRVRNDGTGTVRCPLLLTTDLSPRQGAVWIPDGGSVPFTLETPYRPQAVILDPQGECFRFQGFAPGERLRVESTG